jgi:hypothetical protein
MAIDPIGSSSFGRKSKRRWLIGLVLAAVILFPLAALAFLFYGFYAATCNDLCRPPEAAASAQAAEDARVAALGGAPPADCGGGAVPVHPLVAGTIWDEEMPVGPGESWVPSPYVGQSPVWFNTTGLRVENGLAVEHLARDAETFTIYVQWVTNADFADKIRISISDATSGTELRLVPATYMQNGNVLVPTETDAISVGPTPPYRIFITTVTFPSGGCYTVAASWPGSSWKINLAVGS